MIGSTGSGTASAPRHPPHLDLDVLKRGRFRLADQRRAEALKRHRDGDSFADIARWLGLNHNQVRYLIMQERVEDGEVPRVANNSDAIREALEGGGEFGTPAWVACRAGVIQNDVVRLQRSTSQS